MIRLSEMPAPSSGELQLSIEDLVKRYPGSERNAVDGVSLGVHAGEIFGLLGPNGAGKTSTISVAATRARPTAGRVTLGGQLLRWREAVTFNGPVYAGVMVAASAGMGRKLSADIPQLAIPDWLLTRLADDPSAGVDYACEMLARARESDAFAGVHLIPVRRYREVARRLETLLRRPVQQPQRPMQCHCLPLKRS